MEEIFKKKRKKRKIISIAFIALLLIAAASTGLIIIFSRKPERRDIYLSVAEIMSSKVYDNVIKDTDSLKNLLVIYNTNNKIDEKYNILENVRSGFDELVTNVYLNNILFADIDSPDYKANANELQRSIKKFKDNIDECKAHLAGIDFVNETTEYWAAIDGTEYLKKYVGLIQSEREVLKALDKYYRENVAEGQFVNPFTKKYSWFSSEWLGLLSSRLNGIDVSNYDYWPVKEEVGLFKSFVDLAHGREDFGNYYGNELYRNILEKLDVVFEITYNGSPIALDSLISATLKAEVKAKIQANISSDNVSLALDCVLDFIRGEL